MAKKGVPYGAWVSPITADTLVKGRVKLSEPMTDGDEVYWLEGRPQEDGRVALVRKAPQQPPRDVLPAPYNVRTRVHEYGGGSYLPVGDTLYFSNFADQRLYQTTGGQAPEPITAPGLMRYADFVWDANHQQLVAVREDHTEVGLPPVNCLVTVNPDAGTAGTVLVEGNDFYASPRLNPAGTQLAWLTWNHSNMPWDGTELWVADWDPTGRLGHARCIAGSVTESIAEPKWSPGGGLHFLSDRTGFWNLYRYDAELGVVPLWPKAAEFGVPAWRFRQSQYVFAWDGIVAAYNEKGTMHLAHRREDGSTQEILIPYTSFSGLAGLDGGRGDVVMGAGSATRAPEIVKVSPGGDVLVLRASAEDDVDARYISRAQPISFPTDQGETAYAYFYPPTNPEFAPVEAEERPPLLVFTHGGPTGASSSDFNLEVQYWTSRGFSVVDVNYRGSSGYGRSYRQALLGHWGQYDVVDTVRAAEHLVQQGVVDGHRLAIRGGSAGGYTVLAALTFFDTFHAGASYFGISNLQALVEDTHKFESHYPDGLIGPWPEAADVYRARSPLFHVDQLNTPVIVFQGLEDTVVPPNQSEVIVQALANRGVPVAYLAFEGEGHGFRKAETIRRAEEAEHEFYARIFGLPLPEPTGTPLHIVNLDS